MEHPLMLKKALSLAGLSVLTLSANASLIGNGNYTTDTATGLDWLDLTKTIGRSYSDISSKFSVAQEFEGWRYATALETQNLYVEFGFPVTSIVGQASSEDIARVNNLRGLLGDTLTGSTILDSYGTFGFVIDSSGHTRDMHARITGNLRNTHTQILTNPTGDSGARDYAGSYLVRTSAVPVPAALWLFGSALIGLVGIKRNN